MSVGFPSITKRDLVRTALALGFSKKRQIRHGEMWIGPYNGNAETIIVLPNDHRRKEYNHRHGTIKALVKQLDLTLEEFYSLVNKHS